MRRVWCPLFLVGVLVNPGCVITTNPIDESSTDTDTESSSGPETTAPTAVSPSSSEGGSSSSGGSSGDAPPSCGDGNVDPGEDCDDMGESAACDADCTITQCGDGTLNTAAGEQCDTADLGGQDCESQGLPEGVLACDAACNFDVSGCVQEPAVPQLQLSASAVRRFDLSWPPVPDATHYQLQERPSPAAAFGPIGGDIVGESHSLIVPLHLRYQASYRLVACNDGGCSAPSAAVDAAPPLTEAIGFVKASNTEQSDRFDVVALSGDGSTLVVAAYAENGGIAGIDGDDTDNSAPNSGAVYVFEHDGSGGWTQQAYIKASNLDALDNFGEHLALSHDGNTLAVASEQESSAATGVDGDQLDNSAMDTGAVYVFVRDPMGQWSQQAYIKASNTEPDDEFGSAVALSGDGNTLAVGADGEDSGATGIDGDQDDNGSLFAGAVYVFARNGMGQWSQQAYVKPTVIDAGDNFGSSLALDEDGNTLAIGARTEDGSVAGVGGDPNDEGMVNAGAAYVFVRDPTNQWSQQVYLKALDPGPHDSFAWAIAISSDGDTLAVGAHNDGSSATGIDGDPFNDDAPQSGAVYVFTRDGGGQWAHQAYIKASNAGEEDLFGSAIALADGGDMLAVAAHYEGSASFGLEGNQIDDALPTAGAAYVFLRDPMGQWTQQAYLKATNTDLLDRFGHDLALSADGQVLAVSARGESSGATGVGGEPFDDSAPDSGAVYLY